MSDDFLSYLERNLIRLGFKETFEIKFFSIRGRKWIWIEELPSSHELGPSE